jgi:DnaK suppressor protein
LEKKHQILIAKKIDQEIKKTTDSINEYKQLNKPMAPDNAIGRVSRMDAINNRSVLNAALKKADLKLKKLKIVQKEIDKKDFGVCLNCKNEIPIARLMIVPESKKCINCA